jgi:hypothetical protein
VVAQNNHAAAFGNSLPQRASFFQLLEGAKQLTVPHLNFTIDNQVCRRGVAQLFGLSLLEPLTLRHYVFQRLKFQHFIEVLV